MVNPPKCRIGLLRRLGYLREQFSDDKNHVDRLHFIVLFSAASCMRTDLNKVLYDLLSTFVLISSMHSIVLLKARLVNPGFQALQVPQELQEYQELWEHQELWILWLVPDFLGDGNSVLGNMVNRRMAETMAKYM